MHIVFETERLLVRRYTLEDEEVFFHLNNDPDVVRYIRAPKSRSACLGFLRENIAFYESFPHMGRWAMQLKETGIVAGSFAIIPVENSTDVQLGYSLLKDYWGKGLASEAIIPGRQYAFDNLHLAEIYAITEPGNIASQKILLKSGFIETSGIREGNRELFRYASRNPDYIETSRLKIFPLTAEQLALYLEGGNRLEKLLRLARTGRAVLPSVYEGVTRFTLPKMHAAGTRNWLYHTFWLAVDRETNTIVAELGFKGTPDRYGFVEIGYGTMPGQQGKGFMTEAVHGMIHWVAQKKDIAGVVAEAHRSNRPSIRVLEKNGFRHFDTRGEMLWYRVVIQNSGFTPV